MVISSKVVKLSNKFRQKSNRYICSFTSSIVARRFYNIQTIEKLKVKMEGRCSRTFVELRGILWEKNINHFKQVIRKAFQVNILFWFCLF